MRCRCVSSRDYNCLVPGYQALPMPICVVVGSMRSVVNLKGWFGGRCLQLKPLGSFDFLGSHHVQNQRGRRPPKYIMRMCTSQLGSRSPHV